MAPQDNLYHTELREQKGGGPAHQRGGWRMTGSACRADRFRAEPLFHTVDSCRLPTCTAVGKRAQPNLGVGRSGGGWRKPQKDSPHVGCFLGFKTRPDAPRRTQDAPRRSQDAPRCARRPPRRPKDAPRGRQDAPRRAQDAPRGFQSTPELGK